VVGFKVIPERTAGLIVRLAVWLFPGVAVKTATVWVSTGMVDIVKVALVLPAGIVTEVGNETLAFGDASFTNAPPAGAG
jgi:hypothetical protein